MKHLKITLLAGLILTASFATAHDGATGVVKERMDAMGKIGSYLKSVNAMLRGTATMDLSAIQAAMEDIAMMSNHLPDMFPEGTDAAPSEAGPMIWTDPEGFKALFEEMGTAATIMAASAESNDTAALGPAFGAVAKTCKGCHSDYRINRD